MWKSKYPSLFAIRVTRKGLRRAIMHRARQIPMLYCLYINIKNPDTHDFFKRMEFERFKAEDPKFNFGFEDEGHALTFSFGELEFIRAQIPVIHERLGIWCNLKKFWMSANDFQGSFEEAHPVRLLWLKTTGKTERKYDNEYQIDNFSNRMCYKVASLLRKNDYQFTPELNDYLYLRCGIKFDLDLMDVEIVHFNGIEGQIYPTPSTDT